MMRTSGKYFSCDFHFYAMDHVPRQIQMNVVSKPSPSCSIPIHPLPPSLDMAEVFLNGSAAPRQRNVRRRVH